MAHMQFSLGDHDEEESSEQRPVQGWLEASHNGRLITMTCGDITFSTTVSKTQASDFGTINSESAIHIFLVAARSIISMKLNYMISGA